MDIGKLVDGFLGSSQAGGAKGVGGAAKGLMSNIPGGLAGGAAAGGAVALLLGSKKARKIGGKALTYGGMAAVGALAYSAWKNYKSNPAAAPAQPGQSATVARADASPAVSLATLPPPPADSGFDLSVQHAQDGSDMRLALVQAMISAAKADGHMDAQESAHVFKQMEQFSLGAEEKAFLFDHMQRESDPIAIAKLAKDEPQAAEIYLASSLAIDPDTPEEQRYLERLGDALRLPVALRGQLDSHAAAARAEASV